jgi:hypothetical protein
MTVMDYRTRDGLADYGFSIDYDPDRGWRVHIIFQPFHQGHDGDLRLPYQSIDDKGHRYVDWPEKLDTLGDARVVAALWAEIAQHYQHTREQTAMYVEMVKNYPCTHHRTKAAAVTPAESPSELQESESTTQTVADSTSEMTAKAGGATATVPANSATRNTILPDFPVPKCNHRAAGTLPHRRSTRNVRRHRRGAKS